MHKTKVTVVLLIIYIYIYTGSIIVILKNERGCINITLGKCDVVPNFTFPVSVTKDLFNKLNSTINMFNNTLSTGLRLLQYLISKHHDL